MKFLLLCCLFLIVSCENLTSRYGLTKQQVTIDEFSTFPVLVPNLEMHTATIRKIVSDNDQKYLVTGSFDKTIRIWKYKNARYSADLHKVLHVPIGEGSEGKIYAVAISGNGKLTAAAGWTGISWNRNSNIYIFDTESGQLIHRIKDIPNVVHHLAFSKLGTRLIASVGGENGIFVYDTIYYNLVGRDRYYLGSVYDVDSNALEHSVTTSEDGFIRLYNKDFRLLAKIEGKSGKIPYLVSFAADDLQIAVSYTDTDKVDVFSDKTLNYLFSPDVNQLGGTSKAICWGKDGSLYASGTIQEKQILRRWYPQQENSFTDIETPAKEQIQYLFALTNGDIAFCTADPAFGVVGGEAVRLYKTASIINYRLNHSSFELSPDGAVVKFAYDAEGKNNGYFSIARGRAELLFSPPRNSSGAYIPTLPPIENDKNIVVDNWKDSPFCTINGKKIQNTNEIFRSIAIAKEKKYVSLTTDFHLYLVDANANIIWKKELPLSAWRVNISRNEKFVVTILADGSIHWFDIENGKKLLSFFTTSDKNKKGEWVAWTPQNQYTSSPGGDSLLIQIRNRSQETVPGQQALLQISQTDSISLVLGKKPNFQDSLNEPQDSNENDEVPPQENPSNNLETPKDEKRLFILAIGISEYREKELKLNYAAKDAQDFANLMKKQQNTYSKITVNLITNENANQSEILRGLDKIQEDCGSEDTAIIFLAGHGQQDNYGDYYFLPAEFYPKRGLKKNAIEFDEIQRIITSIQGRVVLLFDTCRSGAVNINKIIDDFSSSRNPLVIIASSTGNQLSFESADWGNGAFTKSLIEGIQGKATYKGKVGIYQLHTYISQRVGELTNGKQTPTIMIPNSISDFVIANSENSN